jgi:hypothetical protein
MPFQTEHLRTSFLAATMVETTEEKRLATNHTQNHARHLILEPCVQVPDSWWKLAFPDWIDLCDLGRAWAVEYGPPRNGPDPCWFEFCLILQGLWWGMLKTWIYWRPTQTNISRMDSLHCGCSMNEKSLWTNPGAIRREPEQWNHWSGKVW